MRATVAVMTTSDNGDMYCRTWVIPADAAEDYVTDFTELHGEPVESFADEDELMERSEETVTIATFGDQPDDE